MRTILSIILALTLAAQAQAQVTCQRVTPLIICSDGSSYQSLGNGQFIYYPPPTPTYPLPQPLPGNPNCEILNGHIFC